MRLSRRSFLSLLPAPLVPGFLRQEDWVPSDNPFAVDPPPYVNPNEPNIPPVWYDRPEVERWKGPTKQEWESVLAALEQHGIMSANGTIDAPHPDQRVRSVGFGRNSLAADGIELFLDTSSGNLSPIVFTTIPGSTSNAILLGGYFDGGTNFIDHRVRLQNATGNSFVIDATVENGGEYAYTMAVNGTNVFAFNAVNFVYGSREVQVAGNFSELTINTGAVTITTSAHTLDTQSDAATDDLDTINSGSEGQILILSGVSAARVVTAKDGTGNLKLAGDRAFNSPNDTLTLVKHGSNWLEVARSTNG